MMNPYLANPLFQLGAGIMSETGRGAPGGQAVGRGILSGMNSLQDYQSQQISLAQAQQQMAEREAMRRRQDQLRQKKAALFGRMSQPSSVMMGPPTPGGIMEQQTLPQTEQQMLYEMAAADPDAVSLQDVVAIQNLPYSRMGEQPKVSMSPTLFRDPITGEYLYGQASATGGFHFPSLPGGVVPVPPESTIPLGDVTVVRPRGGGPEDVYEVGLKPGEQPEVRRGQSYAAAAGKTAGTTAQQAKDMLYGAELDAGRTIEQINALRNHPGLSSATGFSSWMPAIRGTDRADFEARMDQITGGAFLQAYQMLRGGGQITDVEGKKAEQAINRMQQAQSEEDFIRALDDYERAVQDGLKKIQDKAGVKPTGYISEEVSVVPDATQAPPTSRLSRKARRDRQRALEQKYGL